MLKPAKTTMTLIAAGALILGLSACEKQGPAEKAGEQIDQAATRAGEQMSSATEKAGKGMQDLGDKIQGKAEDAQKKD
jgi:hypothetical protein